MTDARDERYSADYAEFIESLPPARRAQFEAAGVAAPDVPRPSLHVREYHNEATTDFERPNDEPVNPLRVFAGLVAWAGSSRARMGVIGKLLDQDQRSFSAIARTLVISPQAVSQAFKSGKLEIERFKAGGPF